MIEFKSGDPIADPRLKVLWIEDRDLVKVALQLRPFIQVSQIRVPEDGEELLQRERPRVDEALAGRSYRLEHCPYDIYIADHRLDEAETHDRELSLAAQAEAAGLTTAVLLASNFPKHPATVIPYTAYESHVRAQRDLLRRLCPPSVNVLWQYEVAKITLDPANALLHAISAHREWLVTAAQQGFIQLRSRERERLLKVLAAPTSNAPWPGKETISIETSWGGRQLYLGALWPEATIQEAPVDPGQIERVLSWIERFPRPSDEEVAAREAALLYVTLSACYRSSARYRLSALLAQGIGPFDEGSLGKEANEICRYLAGPDGDDLDLDIVQGLSKGRPASISIPEAWQCPPITGSPLLAATTPRGERKKPQSTSEAGEETRGSGEREPRDGVRRLAVLYLLALEEHRRALCREMLVEDFIESLPTQIVEFLDDIRALPSAKATLGTDSGAELSRLAIFTALAGAFDRASVAIDEHCVSHKLLATLQDRGVKEREMNLFFEAMSSWKDFDGPEPLTAVYLPRLLDPLPETLRPDATKMIKALERLGFTSPTALLAAGAGGQISSGERRSLQQFARDRGFPQALWPSWMRGAE